MFVWIITAVEWGKNDSQLCVCFVCLQANRLAPTFTTTYKNTEQMMNVSDTNTPTGYTVWF